MQKLSFLCSAQYDVIKKVLQGVKGLNNNENEPLLQGWPQISCHFQRIVTIRTSFIVAYSLTLSPRHACAEINLVVMRPDVEKTAIFYHDDL